MSTFDLKKFLTENSLTSVTRTNVQESSLTREENLKKEESSPLKEVEHTPVQKQEILKLRETLPLIDLGETNGWDQKMTNLHNALIEFETPAESDKAIITSLNPQGTYKQVSQVVAIPRRRYHIVYRVDSSD